MENIDKSIEEMTRSVFLGEVLRRFDKYGVSPWTMEKDLSETVCAKTLYNYMNGVTKPRAMVCNALFDGIKEKYRKLYCFVIDEIKEEFGNITISEILDKI